MKINYYKPREKTYERNWLDRAVWQVIGGGGGIVQDTRDVMSKHAPDLMPLAQGQAGRHKPAIAEAMEDFKPLYPDGISFGALGGHRVAVREPAPPDVPPRQPDFKAVGKILREHRESNRGLLFCPKSQKNKAMPVRRAYILKADASHGPLAFEDKIAQRRLPWS